MTAFGGTPLGRLSETVTYSDYLELDPRVPDLYFESSVFARAGKYLDPVANKPKIKSVFELFSYATQNHLCPPGYEETEVPWFDPQEGADWRNDPAALHGRRPCGVAGHDVAGSKSSCGRRRAR